MTTRNQVAKALFVTQASVALLSLPTTIMMARLLGPGDYGRYQFMNRVSLVLVALFCIGLPHAVAWYTASPLRAAQARKLLRLIFVCSLFGGIGCTISILGISLVTNVAALSDWLIVIPFAFLNLLSANLVNYFRGQLDIRGIRSLKYSQVVSWTAMIVVLGFSHMLGLQQVLFCTVIAQLISVILPIGRLLRNKLLFGNTEEIATREIIKFAIDTLPGLALRDFGPYVGQLVVGFLLPVDQLGFYSLALAIVGTLGILSGPINNTVQPFIQKSEKTELVGTVTRSVAASILIVGVPAIIIAAVSAPVIPVIFGQQYSQSAPLVALLCFSVLFDSISSGWYGILLGVGKPKISSRLTLVTFTSQIVLLFLIVPKFGTFGAVVSALLANAFGAILMTHQVSKLLKVRPLSLAGDIVKSIPETGKMLVHTVFKRAK